MAKITNTLRRPLTLATKHVVPRLGELITTNEVIQHTDNWPTLKAMWDVGEIGVELDPTPEVVSPVYPTDPVPVVVEVPKKMVYSTDPVAVVVEVANTPVYSTDPVKPEPIPVMKTPVYATDPLPPELPPAPEALLVEPAVVEEAPVEPPAKVASTKVRV